MRVESAITRVAVDEHGHEVLAAERAQRRTRSAGSTVDGLDLDALVRERQRDALDVGGVREAVEAKHRAAKRDRPAARRAIRSLAAATSAACSARSVPACPVPRIDVRDWQPPDGVRARLGADRARLWASTRALLTTARGGSPRRGIVVAATTTPARRAGGPRGGIAQPESMLDDLRATFAELGGHGRSCSATPGGAVAARAVTGGWVAPRGLILSSPALRVPPMSRAEAACSRSRGGSRPTRAPEPAARRQALPRPARGRRLPRRPARARSHHAADVRLHRGRRRARPARRAAARGPDAAARGGRGPARGPARGARVRRRARAGVGTLRWYDGLYHELFNEREPDRERVLADLTAGSTQRLTASTVSGAVACDGCEARRAGGGDHGLRGGGGGRDRRQRRAADDRRRPRRRARRAAVGRQRLPADAERR